MSVDFADVLQVDADAQENPLGKTFTIAVAAVITIFSLHLVNKYFLEKFEEDAKKVWNDVGSKAWSGIKGLNYLGSFPGRAIAKGARPLTNIGGKAIDSLRTSRSPILRGVGTTVGGAADLVGDTATGRIFDNIENKAKFALGFVKGLTGLKTADINANNAQADVYREAALRGTPLVGGLVGKVFDSKDTDYKSRFPGKDAIAINRCNNSAKRRYGQSSVDYKAKAARDDALRNAQDDYTFNTSDRDTELDELAYQANQKKGKLDREQRAILAKLMDDRFKGGRDDDTARRIAADPALAKAARMIADSDDISGEASKTIEEFYPSLSSGSVDPDAPGGIKSRASADALNPLKDASDVDLLNDDYREEYLNTLKKYNTDESRNKARRIISRIGALEGNLDAISKDIPSVNVNRKAISDLKKFQDGASDDFPGLYDDASIRRGSSSGGSSRRPSGGGSGSGGATSSATTNSSQVEVENKVANVMMNSNMTVQQAVKQVNQNRPKGTPEVKVTPELQKGAQQVIQSSQNGQRAQMQAVQAMDNGNFSTQNNRKAGFNQARSGIEKGIQAELEATAGMATDAAKSYSKELTQEINQAMDDSNNKTMQEVERNIRSRAGGASNNILNRLGGIVSGNDNVSGDWDAQAHGAGVNISMDESQKDQIINNYSQRMSGITPDDV